MALHWQILWGMAAGVVFALILSQFNWGPQFIRDWIKPFGTIFINSLKLIAVPLILASLIKGVSDLGDLSKLSKMGTRTIITFILTTFVAVSIGLLCVNIIKPGNAISAETRSDLLASYAGEITSRVEMAQEQKKPALFRLLKILCLLIYLMQQQIIPKCSRSYFLPCFLEYVSF